MAVPQLLMGAVWTLNSALWTWLFGVLAGALFATLLPRLAAEHKRVTRGAGKWVPHHWRKLALAVHGALIIREAWRLKPAGTCHAYAAAIRSWLSGKGFQLCLPAAAPLPALAKGASEEIAAVVAVLPCSPANSSAADRWYVGDKDLEFFRYHAEQDGPVAGASSWQLMMDKDVPNVLKYTAWRRTLPGGSTEYKSISICPDATALEFNDLYFDDDFRVNWDEMVIHHEVLEQGDFAERQQVVRWIRRFPFAFLSDREYTIARRLFRVGDRFYGLTKAVDHPRAQASCQVVHMDVFHSMWESHDVPCPWNSGRVACATTLLHHEQFKIPERLGRLAVRVGMWKFVQKMAEQVPRFLAERRTRVGPTELDPQAYGAGYLPNPPLRRGPTGVTDSSCTLSSLAPSEEDAVMNGGDQSPRRQAQIDAEQQAGGRPLGSQYAYVPRPGALRRAKGVVLLAVLGGVALLARRSRARSGDTDTQQGRPASRRRHHRSGATVWEEVGEGGSSDC